MSARFRLTPRRGGLSLGREVGVVEVVTLREIEKIFEVTDRLGIHREQLVIPLGPRHPGRVRRMPNGKIEIVVESEGDFDDWVSGLETELRRAAAL
jgi:hypothetical protein